METSERVRRERWCARLVILGIKWPFLAHPQYSKVIVSTDVTCVCPRRREEDARVHRPGQSYWKRWAAKHEYEELKEGILVGAGSGLASQEDGGRLDGKTSTCCQGRYGFGRRTGPETTIRLWIGQMKASAKLVTRRKAQKSTVFRMAQSSSRFDERFRSLSQSGSKRRELQRRSSQ